MRTFTITRRERGDLGAVRGVFAECGDDARAFDLVDRAGVIFGDHSAADDSETVPRHVDTFIFHASILNRRIDCSAIMHPSNEFARFSVYRRGR